MQASLAAHGHLAVAAGFLEAASVTTVQVSDTTKFNSVTKVCKKMPLFVWHFFHNDLFLSQQINQLLVLFPQIVNFHF
ncbi:hypothetical protein BH10BAC2_BH10BAC2_17980 [soil metagenome]